MKKKEIPKLLISACLLGIPCRYDGRFLPLSEEYIKRLAKNFTLIPICPEQLGGLPTPRPPAEIQSDGQIVNKEGQDVSENYVRGAEAALEIAKITAVKLACMKNLSPSCGNSHVYDGSFQRVRVQGKGITVKHFEEAGIKVYNEKEIEFLLKECVNV